MSEEDAGSITAYRLRRLNAALQILLKYCTPDGTQVRLEPNPGCTPDSNHVAWTYPADAFLEGPANSIAIGFKKELLQLPAAFQLTVLCHELGHACLHMHRIRKGETPHVDEGEATDFGKDLFMKAFTELGDKLCE